jgi:hypothetical protein
VQALLEESVLAPEDPEPDAVAELLGVDPAPDDPVLDAPELALAGALAELDEPVPPAGAAAPADVDCAAQPAPRSPALSSGTTSSAFFTRSPCFNRVGDALMSLMTL